MIKVLMSLIDSKGKDGVKYYRDRNGNVRVYV